MFHRLYSDALISGTVTIDETNSSGHQLFEYMLQPEHAELYNMRRLHMQGGVNDDLEMVSVLGQVCSVNIAVRHSTVF